VRVPFLVRWPGQVKAGTSSDRIISTPDIFSTVIEACGLPAVSSAQDSVSFLPTLRGESLPPRAPIFWHYPHYGNQGGFPGGAIREGDWKLIERYETGALELYNLANDLRERSNLAEKEQARVQAMLAKLAAWRNEVGAKMPAVR
jgi:arylsulfatase A-like enzyme